MAKTTTPRSIKVPVAVIFDSESFVHSAMASGNSLWSAGQRIHAAKKKGQRLCAEKTTLTISLPLARRLGELANAIVKARYSEWQ